MNFRVLKEIIVTLKEKIKCEACGKRFSNKEINIVDTEEQKATLKCNCSKCNMQTIIDISLVNQEELADMRDHQGLQVRAETMNTISDDDILDVKNFLKNFKGDFKTLFKH
jgi:hypothetical protein